MSKYRITEDEYKDGRVVYYVERKFLLFWDRYDYSFGYKSYIFQTESLSSAKAEVTLLRCKEEKKKKVIRRKRVEE